MQVKRLYRYARPDGGITDSITRPNCEYIDRVRIIADDGKALTNGETVTTCVDTDTAEGWWEIDAPPEETPEEIPEEEIPEEIPEEEETDTTTYAELAQVYREGVNSIE